MARVMRRDAMQGDSTSLVSHSHVIDTMRTHHQVLLDQAEMHSKQALLELKGKTEDVQGLQTRVDGDLAEVRAWAHVDDLTSCRLDMQAVHPCRL